MHRSSRESKGIQLDSLTLDDKQAEAAPIVYSAMGQEPSLSDDPANRKGFKVWMGGKVIYTFEDEDQGDFDEQGVYTFIGHFQLQIIPYLQGVYVQVLTASNTPAIKAHAEEILWHIKRGL